MRITSTHKKIGIISILALICLSLPLQSAHADPGVLSFFSSPFSTILEYTVQWVFARVGELIALFSQLLNFTINLRAGGNIPVVAATWTILRDFANMMFIVLLIYMAFATIFNQQNFTFQSMIGRFVIVALLINFSLVIGNLVIDACQVLTNIFLGSIGSLGDRLGQYLNPMALLPTNGADVAAGSLMSLIFALIMALIFFFSIAIATVFSLIRVPFIWGLLIISPFAWMSYILPGTKHRFKEWWNLFLGWNLFLPVYLFFIYLGLYFLSQRDKIIGAVITYNGTGPNPADGSLLKGLAGSLSFNLFFFYIFAGFVMVGGLAAARKTTSLMGTGFDKGVGWARTTVGKITKYDGQRAAITGAAGQKLGQIQKEGFRTPWLNKLYGGKEGDARRQTRWAQRLGVRGVGKEFVSEVETEANKLREEEKLGKIQINEGFKTAAAGESNTSARGIAMRSLLYERGMIDEKEFAKDMGTWTQSNPAMAQSMAEKAKKGKYKSVSPTELLKMAAAEGQHSNFQNPQATALRRDWFDFVKDNDKALAGMTVDQYGKAISLFGGPKTNASAEYRKAIAKKRPDLVVDYDMESKGLDIANNRNLRTRLLYKELKDKKATDIAQMLDKTWKDPDFTKAIELNMGLLDKKDPPVKQGEVQPNGKKANKNYSGGGANLKSSLRKSAARSGSKLKILRNIRPEELSGEAAAELQEQSAESIARTADLTKAATEDDINEAK